MTNPWMWHGGGVEAAKRHFGGADWLDLSTGMNPDPWPGAEDIAIDWQRLPDTDALRRLEEVAARFFGVAPEHVCAVPGTEIGLRLTGSLIGGEARYMAPSYRTHGEMIADAAAIDRAGSEHHDGTLILANPNNPDGGVIEADVLHDILDRRTPESWLLIDEAFADPEPTISLAGLVSDTRNLVIFRSFGKFFGLAGVRLGFVLGPPSILDPLRRLLGAWPLSAAAVEIGTAAYQDEAWIAATRHRLPEQAAALDAILAGAGHQPIGECPLFRLIEVDDAQSLFERLAGAAILTRPFADKPQWLRIGLPSGDATAARLAAALAHG